MDGQWFAFVAVPVIGAFIGWVTNWVAVKMLFHPRRECSLLGLTIQGVFPKRQKALAARLGDVVSDQLISIEDIKGKINRNVLGEELGKLMDAHLERVLLERLPQALPMLAMFINPGIVKTVRDALQEDISHVVGEVIDKVGSKIATVVDIRAVVREKVEALSGDRVEELLEAIMKSEFRFIEVVGGVLGFLIGVIQVLITQIPL